MIPVHTFEQTTTTTAIPIPGCSLPINLAFNPPCNSESNPRNQLTAAAGSMATVTCMIMGAGCTTAALEINGMVVVNQPGNTMVTLTCDPAGSGKFMTMAGVVVTSLICNV